MIQANFFSWHPYHQHYHQVMLIAEIHLPLSLVIHPYRPSLLESPLNGTQCPQKADQRKFLLFTQHWCVHGKMSNINTHHVFVNSFGWWWDGRQMAIQLLFCGLLLPEFVQNSMQYVCIVPIKHFVKIQMVQPNNSSDTATAWKNFHFIISGRSDFVIL